MSTIDKKGSVRVLGRKVGRELSAEELASVVGGSGRTGPHGNGSYDTDYH
jgi:bacteriocin-like protein